MSVRYTCACGCRIALPTKAVGRKARCRQCGVIFTVPAAEPAVTPIRPAAKEPAVEESLSELFALAEEDAPAAKTPAGSHGGSGPPGTAPPPFKIPEVVIEVDETPDASFTAFCADVLQSFLFITKPANLAMFAVLVVFYTVFAAISAMAGLFALVGLAVLGGYICAFFMLIIAETAGGSDDLPNVSVSNLWDDLFAPLLRFLGTWLIVMIPALVYGVLAAVMQFDPWIGVTVLAVVGVFFWPVVVLGVALGYGAGGLTPPMVLRTVLAAPFAYVALWIALLMALALDTLPFTAVWDRYVVVRATGAGIFGSYFLASAIQLYASIITMRAIGLFYRHYRRRFPWSGE